MDACRFSYISAKTNMPRTAVGINRSWDSLRVDFGRSGPGVPGATHYKTISLEGPEIFAVLDNKQVFYHDRGEWYRYITAEDVRFAQINTTEDMPRVTTEEENQHIMLAFSQEEPTGVENDDYLLV